MKSQGLGIAVLGLVIVLLTVFAIMGTVLNTVTPAQVRLDNVTTQEK